MYSPRTVADRLRIAAGCPSHEPLDTEWTLLLLYPVSFFFLAGLNIHRICDMLAKYRFTVPPSLMLCSNRRLRGGIVAQKGSAMVFLDADDPDDERRYAAAHEAGHFLRDHWYPREDALEKLGEGVRHVLDGERLPTFHERLHALLSSATLCQYIHLMDREEATGGLAPEIAVREAEADAFAWEILAPSDAIADQFDWSDNRDTDIQTLLRLLTTKFRLPQSAAQAYANHLAAHYAPLPPAWSHLRLVK